LSDLTAGLVGGLGLIPGANIGNDAALFEAVHGSAPDITGKNIANPTAVIMAGVMMLHHLGETEAAERIQSAVEKVVSEGKQVTPDLNPDAKAGTVEMGDAIVARPAKCLIFEFSNEGIRYVRTIPDTCRRTRRRRCCAQAANGGTSGGAGRAD
ncbi:MAG: hypothetical protein CTY34_11800, partial [Methylobacter sp.]